jgi:hypothetical protein
MADEEEGEEATASIDLFGHKYSFVWTDSGPTLQYSTDGIVTMTRRKESVVPFVTAETEEAAEEKPGTPSQKSESEYESFVRQA